MPTKKFMNNEKIIAAIFHQITEFGSAIITGVIAILLLFFHKEMAARLIITMALVTILSYAIKALFFKKRPKRQSTRTMVEKIDAASFPSVHSARITVLVFWLVIYSLNVYLDIILSLLLIVVAYSRIYLRKHYWTDVIGGVIISLIVSSLIYFLFRNVVLL